MNEIVKILIFFLFHSERCTEKLSIFAFRIEICSRTEQVRGAAEKQIIV